MPDARAPARREQGTAAENGATQPLEFLALSAEQARRSHLFRRRTGGPRGGTRRSERLLATSSVRRGLIVGSILSVLLVALVSSLLAWRQYDSAKRQALTDLDARVVAVNAILDLYFSEQINALDAVAKAPAVVRHDPVLIQAYIRRLDQKNGLFPGGIFWLDRRGQVRASGTLPSSPGTSVANRLYFRRVVRTGKPYVSSGLIGRQTGQTIVVIAVPTKDARGRLTGVLGGRLVFKTGAKPSRQSLALGFGNLTIVDRNGRLLQPGLPRVTNTDLLRQMRKKRTGIIASSPGLEGTGDHAVLFATSQRSNWITLIDRPRSTVFASALRSFVLELASMGVSAALVLALLALLIRRASRRESEQDVKARSWTRLTRRLMSAMAPEAITVALLDALVRAFPDSIAFVAIGDEHAQLRAASGVRAAPISAESMLFGTEIARLGGDAPRSFRLDRHPSLSTLQRLPGNYRGLHVEPVLSRDGARLGTVALLTTDEHLDNDDWDLLATFGAQAAIAVERTDVFAHEHELSLQLQRALLPDQLPALEGISLSGHYLAGAAQLEVGGDWYDAVQRPDGILQLCVGDVSGRGISAATVMVGLRNAFDAYALEYSSPAQILQRMMRHVREGEFITVACVSVDPSRDLLTYSLAGHLPPLLVDRDSGEVTRLDVAAGPPFGAAEFHNIIETTVPLPKHATLALYTDGLVERRGRDLYEGMTILGDVLADDSTSNAREAVARVSAVLGETGDDLALLLVAFSGSRAGTRIDIPADPSSLPRIRQRLRAWLAALELDPAKAEEIVLAVSEACNNAIEHARPSRDDVITVILGADAEMLTATVEDHGRWIEPNGHGDRGRGLALMRRLMDSVEIERGREGTRVILRRRRPMGGRSKVAGPARPAADPDPVAS